MLKQKRNNKTISPRTLISSRFKVLGLAIAVVLLLLPVQIVSSAPNFLAAPNFTWTPTGSMIIPRFSATTTVLANGKVLVVGGTDGENVIASAELYDPATGSWSLTGSLNSPRASHFAALLPNGRVLVGGGTYGRDVVLTTELYDPATGSWSFAAPTEFPRYDTTATTLLNGKVLVAGAGGERGPQELYDFKTNSWSETPPMSTFRYNDSATLLADGKVLVAGGSDSLHEFRTNKVDLYNPTTNSWSLAASMKIEREDHTATLLLNGKVLVAGGGSRLGNEASAELYDPNSNSWSDAGRMQDARTSHNANLLPDGKVLVEGGYGGPTGILSSSEIYDPATNSWTYTAAMSTARSAQISAPLKNGQVLVSGGKNSAKATKSAELFGKPKLIDNSQRLTSDLVAQLRVSPDREAATNPDTLITVSFKVKNLGEGQGEQLRLELPFDQALVVGYGNFSDTRVWISAVTSNLVIVSLPPLGTNETVSGSIVFRPSPDTPPTFGTKVSLRYKLSFSDPTGSGSRPSNMVGFSFAQSSVDNSNGAVTSLNPAVSSVSAGEKLTFRGDCFLPGEFVSTWITKPDGTSVALGQLIAGAEGEISLTLDTTGLAAGSYVVAAYGNRSELTGSAGITIT